MFCPKCGNNLPENASFCGKCGHQLAPAQVQVPKQPAAAAMPAASRVAAPIASTASTSSLMPLVRLALGAILLMLLVAPIATMLGYIEFSFVNSGSPVEIAIYTVAGVLVLTGAVLEKFLGFPAGRWLSLAGFIAIAVLLIVEIVGISSAVGGLEGAELLGVTFGWGAWLIAILSIGGIVTCFVKNI